MTVRQREDIILVGGGGHCRSCIDVIEAEGRFTIRGVVDANANLPSPVLEYELLGGEDNIERLSRICRNFFITVGQIKDWKPRARLFEYLKSLHVTIPIVISPFAHVSRYATIDEGSIVMHHAMVNSGACVGKNCIINSNALVEHDVSIEDHCHISTAAVVNGAATVRRCTFVGSNAIIREGIDIGDNSVVGAGMIVLQSVMPGSLLRFQHYC